MPQGSKEKYTAKQKKQAEHIETGYERKGIPHRKAEALAWATVNKQSGGGEASGSGTKISTSQKKSARKDSAKNAVNTRQDKAKPDSLESRTKQYLLDEAKEKNIPNRSRMKKAELILALRRSS